jgi:hypothetical protein
MLRLDARFYLLSGCLPEFHFWNRAPEDVHISTALESRTIFANLQRCAVGKPIQDRVV